MDIVVVVGEIVASNAIALSELAYLFRHRTRLPHSCDHRRL